MKKFNKKSQKILLAIALLFILLAMALSFLYFAEWHQKTWTVPRKIAGYSSNAYSPQIFASQEKSAEHYAIATWKEFDDANQTYSIWASLYNEKRNSWKISQALSAHDLIQVSAPQIAGNEKGDVIVIWSQTDRQTGLQQLWSNRYDPGLMTWLKTQAASASTAKIENLQITIDNNANAIAIWQQTEDGIVSVWQNQFDFQQQRWKQAQKLANNANSPRLAMNSNGNAVVVWQAIEQNNQAATKKINNVWVSLYEPNKRNWQPAQKISDGIRNSKQANVAIGENGQILVAWNQESVADANGKTTHAVWVNRYRLNKAWDVIKKISSDSSVLLEAPQVGIDQHGNEIVAWQQNEAIWVNRFVANQTWELAQLISGNAQGVQAYAPHLAIAKNGDATLAWIQDNKPHNALFVSQYTEKQKWLAPQQISEGSEDIVATHLAINDRLESILLWQQNDGEQDSIAFSAYR